MADVRCNLLRFEEEGSFCETLEIGYLLPYLSAAVSTLLLLAFLIAFCVRYRRKQRQNHEDLKHASLEGEARLVVKGNKVKKPSRPEAPPKEIPAAVDATINGDTSSADLRPRHSEVEEGS